MNTNEIGSRAEGAVLGALVRAGYSVLIPFGVMRYDLAVDTPEGIKRVQCKAGRLVDGGGAVVFPVRDSRSDKKRTSYRGVADLFGVYCHGNGECYLVPVSDVGINECRLRLMPAKNNQSVRTRLASDYVLK